MPSSPSSSPFVPGAWPSDSTVSLLLDPVETMLSTATPDAEIDNVQPSRDKAARYSTAFTDESAMTDDFYSCASDEGADDTLRPGPSTADDDLDFQCKQDIPPLSYHSRQGSTSSGSFEIGTSLNEVPSRDSSSSDAHPVVHGVLLPAWEENPGPFPRIFLHAVKKAASAPLKTSLSAQASGPSITDFGADSEHDGSYEASVSAYSEESLTDHHSRQTARAYSANTSRQSLSPSEFPFPPRTSVPVLRRNALVEDQRAGPSNTLLLSQPDGTDPWTLTLDRRVSTPGSMSVESTAQSSSLTSDASSSTSHEGVDAQDAQDDVLTPFPGGQGQYYPFPHGEGDETRPRRGIDMSLSDIPQFYGAGVVFPPMTKNRKAKGFFTKVKRFFTPGKGSKPDHLRGLSPLTIQTSFPTANTAGSTVTDSSYLDTPSTYGLTNYRRAWTKSTSAKASAHSVALSFRPEEYQSHQRPISFVPEDRLTYEYHARPKTLEEIKANRAKRRFSLPPAFSGSSSRPGSAPGWSHQQKGVLRH